MAPKYQVGQKVIITPVKAQPLSPRDAALEPYAGCAGRVNDFHWISPGSGSGTFYIYTVMMETDEKEIVVHEDELTACIE